MNMIGRTCVITGANSGIGLASAKALAIMGAEIILVCRNPQKAEQAIKDIRALSPNAQLTYILTDLSISTEVKRLASDILALGRPIHILLNNAGCFTPTTRMTKENHELTFAVNYFAPYILTRLLADRLSTSPDARVINISSGMHGFTPFPIHRINKLSGAMAYPASKLANVMFALEMAERHIGEFTVNCMDPGMVNTNFGGELPWWMLALSTPFRPFLRTPEEGAETAVYLASSAEVEGITGKYFKDRKLISPSAFALDTIKRKELWARTARFLKMDE